MPLSFQVKLLRALDGKGFTPVGDNRVKKTDFRLISATNRDLAQMVRLGKMRQDFYYRINTVPILMPPLRDRKEDLPLLIDHFTKLYTKTSDGDTHFPPEFYLTLDRHHWPGNVRELQNVIRRYFTLNEISFNPSSKASLGRIAPVPSSRLHMGKKLPIKKELALSEKSMILSVLNENRWHMGKTAEVLGISRRTLQRKVGKYGLK